MKYDERRVMDAVRKGHACDVGVRALSAQSPARLFAYEPGVMEFRPYASQQDLHLTQLQRSNMLQFHKDLSGRC